MTDHEENEMNDYLDIVIERLDARGIVVTINSVFKAQHRYSRSAIAKWLKKWL